MSMIAPAAPLMLFGATAVAVPIALHFFYKARYKPLPWAAMNFLKQAVEQTSRRLKFQEWVLLALRCLLLLLIALALSQLQNKSATLSARGEAVDAVFLIDTSYTMGARDGEKTRLEQEKEEALRVLDSLPPRSTVQIFTSSDRANLIGPKVRTNLDQARQTLKTVVISNQSTDFLPGFTDAIPTLTSGSSPAKEVYLFSDLQKSGFERQQSSLHTKAEEIRKLGGLVLVRCSKAGQPTNNAAITDITMPTVIPHTGTRVPFDVLVRNTGGTTLSNIRVTLSYRERSTDRDEARDEKTIDRLEKDETIPVTLSGLLTAPGSRVITARLSGDDLPGDNEFHKVILVRNKLNVVIIDGSPDANNPTEAGSHFVRAALAPVSDTLRKDYVIQPSVYTPEQASAAVLEEADVVYLVNVPSSSEAKAGVAGLSKSFVEALATYVRDGGGLVIACGDLVDAEGYNKVLGSGGQGLLPFDLGEIASTAEQYPYQPAPESVDDTSFLGPFKTKYSAVFRSPEITRMYKLKESGSGSTGGRVVARVSNGQPLVASRVLGKGEVILCTTSFDSRWGNFPTKSDAFVPMTSYTLLHLSGRKAEAGEFTNPDLRETQNLDVAQDADVENYLGFKPSIINAGSDTEAALGQHRSAKEYTEYVLLLVLLLVVLEAGWAWFCGRSV